MKFEVLFTNGLNRKCKGAICFDATDNDRNRLVKKGVGTQQGIVIFDNNEEGKDYVEFSYSPTFNDGDIFGGNDLQRMFIKRMIPGLVYAKAIEGEL